MRQTHSDFNKSVFDVLKPLYLGAHTLAEALPLRQASTMRVRKEECD